MASMTIDTNDGRGSSRNQISIDTPVLALLKRIAGPAASATPDLRSIGAALADFASDVDYLQRWMDRISSDGGGVVIHAPERGPRIQIVHRPKGEMGPVHDHGVWVALAAITGVEHHRRYRQVGPDRSAMPELVDTIDLAACDVVTMLPPDDIHDHGHLLDHGRPAYILVMTGDDQTRYERNEWDLDTGRHRILGPDDGGRFLATDEWPED